MKKVAIIGCGNMGEVILDAIKSCGVRTKDILVVDVDREKLERIKKCYKVKVSQDVKLLKSYEFLIIAVKPQQVKDLFLEIRSFVNNKAVLVSVAAGISIKFIRKFFDRNEVVRCMPNLPLKVGKGITVISFPEKISGSKRAFVRKIFSVKGEVLELPEEYLDLITAVSGSGPAYIFYISEIMQRAAQKLGFSRKTSQLIVNQTILGAAEMLVRTKLSAEKLRESVTSKGGTTEQALNIFYKKRLENIFLLAIKSAYMRAKELSKIFG